MAKKKAMPCQWVCLRDALTAFVKNIHGHQGSEHIRQLHWYVACRLVIEGGFAPEEVMPRPPFVVRRIRGARLLEHMPASAGAGEQVVLGGLKTKAVDVVVAKPGVGPVIAVSLKGTLRAFRNLTNRMEEAVGDCTNLHISYPTLVYGFLHVLRGNTAKEGHVPNDVALHADDQVADGILRYHEVLSRLAGRNDVRDVSTKYEAIALAIVSTTPRHLGTLMPNFPPGASALAFDGFFDTLYSQYDLRFVFAAPKLKRQTRRLIWHPDSPILSDPKCVGFNPRMEG